MLRLVITLTIIVVFVVAGTVVGESKDSPGAVCGDCNGDSQVSLGDAVYIFNYIFAGGPAPDPLETGDVDCNGQVTLGDAVYIINYIFGGGPEPCLSCP